MKVFAVLVVLLSGFGWGYARARSLAQDARLRGHGERAVLLDRSLLRSGDRGRVQAKLGERAEDRNRAIGAVPGPMLLMLFGGLMFFLSWVCVAWSSWKEHKAAPVWDGADGEILAEAG